MSAKSPIVSRAEPGRQACPVCGSDSKSCSATEDGLHLCRGEPSAGWFELPPRQVDDAGFRHFRRDTRPATAPPAAGVTDFAELARRRAAGLAASPHYLAQLATDLGVPADALRAFGLGLHHPRAGGDEFVIPERDGTGAVVGLATRTYRDGQPPVKKCVKGSTRGLTVPDGWRDRPGPLFVVEGFTDAAAMTAGGLCAVGRPSNAGGADHLARLLADWPADRPVVLVIENDEKPDGQWPGRAGTEQAARRLAGLLGRAVHTAQVPGEAKDVRGWLTDPARGATPWPERGAALAALLAEAVERIDPPAPGDPTIAPGGRPEIVITTAEHLVNDQAAAAIGRDPDVFCRGGALVHVLSTADDDEGASGAVRRPAGAPVIRELARPTLRERLTRVADWKGVRGTGEAAELVPRHPPDWCIQAVQARGVWHAVRRLEAIVEHPVLLCDGSVLAASGYHARSRLLACLPAGLAVAVPDRPTPADAAKAVAALLDVVCDFPFETPAHRAALVAGLLTPLAWFAFDGPAPLFLIDKNVRGAGAGLLADVVSLVVAGRRFSVMAYTSDRDELRKRITTVAIEGERMVLLDNLAGAVGNDVLDAALTADTWKDRVLGSNKGFDGPLHVTWFGTGNNVQLAADTSRRTCHVRMESLEELPELRTGFRHRNLRAHVLANRGPLLSAALTILRALHVAGRPRHGLPAWGSFEGWSDAVREAVVFAGLPDPGETRTHLQGAADRDAAAMAAVLDGVARMATGCRGVTAAEIVSRLRDCQNEDWKLEFRAAVEDLCGKLDVRPLSMKLRSFKRRNFGGRMLDAVAGHAGLCLWEVVVAGSRAADGSTTARTLSGWDGGNGGDVSADAERLGSNSKRQSDPDTIDSPAARRTRRRSAPDDRGAAL